MLQDSVLKPWEHRVFPGAGRREGLAAQGRKGTKPGLWRAFVTARICQNSLN
jgi:hypothetical protein